MPRTRKVNAVWAAKAVDLLTRQGQPTADILRQAGLKRQDLDGDDAMIPFRKFADLLDAAAQLSQDRHFGLRLGLESDPREDGVIGYIASNSATLGDAFRNAVRFQRISNEGTEATLDIGEREVAVEIEILDRDIEPTNARQVMEFDFSSICAAITVITEQRPPLTEVEFRHQDSGDMGVYTEIFGIAPLFGRGRNAFAMPTDFFAATPIVDADARLLKILLRHAEDVLARTPAIDDLVGQVRATINGHLVDGAPPIATVAADLAMSQRTLSRRLHELDTSYRAVVDDLRHDLALEYLSDPELGLSTIAFLLGFRDLSAFTHAFRRWTQVSPSSYRRRMAA